MHHNLVRAIWTALLSATIASHAIGDDNISPRFRVAVELVNLALTVTDPELALITDLVAEDFSVYEDGVEQTIEFFSKEDLPLRMVILLDTSASMLEKLPVAQEAAVGFVRSLGSEDSVQVIEFNKRVHTLVDFTSDFDRVADAIRTTAPGGDTSLYESLYVSLSNLSGRRGENERRAVVVLTDGADTDSLVTFDAVRELARRTDAMIYSVCLFGSYRDMTSELLEAKYELYKLAKESGGAGFTVDSANELDGTYARIANELRKQYHLGYVPSRGTEARSWRRIQVLCDRTDLQLRTRSGYYAHRLPRNARRQ